MNQERLLQILLAPHVSEKGTRVGDQHHQVVFRVVRDASKPEVKRAVEQLFEVEVECVRTTNVKGKKKSFARVQGKRRDWKKAYVSLKPGHDIDFTGGE